MEKKLGIVKKKKLKIIRSFTIFILCLFTKISWAHDIEHFFMPNDSELAQKSILEAINKSKYSIDIAMFMFTNKKIAQALIKKSKNSNENTIRVIVDKSFYNSAESKVYRLSKARNIQIFLAQGLPKKSNKTGLMHTKLLIIDDKIVYVGSTNFTKSAFSVNYEVLLKIRDKTTAKLYKLYLNQILVDAESKDGTINNDK